MATATMKSELKQAERKVARLEKLLRWTDAQLQKLIDANAEERAVMLAEVDAIDGEKHPVVEKKIRKKREKKG